MHWNASRRLSNSLHVVSDDAGGQQWLAAQSRRFTSKYQAVCNVRIKLTCFGGYRWTRRGKCSQEAGFKHHLGRHKSCNKRITNFGNLNSVCNLRRLHGVSTDMTAVVRLADTTCCWCSSSISEHKIIS